MTTMGACALKRSLGVARAARHVARLSARSARGCTAAISVPCFWLRCLLDCAYVSALIILIRGMSPELSAANVDDRQITASPENIIDSDEDDGSVVGDGDAVGNVAVQMDADSEDEDDDVNVKMEDDSTDTDREVDELESEVSCFPRNDSNHGEQLVGERAGRWRGPRR